MAVTAPLDRVYTLSVNPNFQHRLSVALIDEVATVANEPGGTTNHTNRINFAALVLYNPDGWAAKMAEGVVVSNANMQTAIAALGTPTSDNLNAAATDADIKVAVGVVWNFFADAAQFLGLTTTKVI